MFDPKNDDVKKTTYFDRIQNDKRIEDGLRFLRKWWLELICGCLMFIGIVMTFFYRNWGGIFVGLSFGIYFFPEIKHYLFYARRFYSTLGLFKTLMWLGVLFYFLVANTTFILSIAFIFGIIFFLRHKKTPV